MKQEEMFANICNEQIIYARDEHTAKMAVLIEQQEMNLISILKPKIYKDGNEWCVLYGENIQEGVAGFGDTPRKAIYAFNKAFDHSEKPY